MKSHEFTDLTLIEMPKDCPDPKFPIYVTTDKWVLCFGGSLATKINNKLSIVLHKCVHENNSWFNVALTHELGHLLSNHNLVETNPKIFNFKEEFQADLCSFLFVVLISKSKISAKILIIKYLSIGHYISFLNIYNVLRKKNNVLICSLIMMKLLTLYIVSIVARAINIIKAK
jgi:hypothetical protein